MCLNILREDWKPVLNLNAVIVGLQVSFRVTRYMQFGFAYGWNSISFWSRTPLIRSTKVCTISGLALHLSNSPCTDAAEDLRLTRDAFKRNVRTSMAGGSVKQIQFDNVMKRK